MKRDHTITVRFDGRDGVGGKAVCGTCRRPVVVKAFGGPINDGGWLYPATWFYAHVGRNAA